MNGAAAGQGMEAGSPVSEDPSKWANSSKHFRQTRISPSCSQCRQRGRALGANCREDGRHPLRASASLSSAGLPGALCPEAASLPYLCLAWHWSQVREVGPPHWLQGATSQQAFWCASSARALRAAGFTILPLLSTASSAVSGWCPYDAMKREEGCAVASCVGPPGLSDNWPSGCAQATGCPVAGAVGGRCCRGANLC